MRLCVAILVFSTLVACSSRPDSQTGSLLGNTLTKVTAEKALRVAYINYPPSAFKDPQTGEVKGHFVDTVKEIARQLDPTIRVNFEETTWTDFSAALNTGRVDLSIAGTFATIPRAKVVSFTRPLTYLGRSAVVRRGDNRFSPTAGPLQFDRPDIKIAVVDGEGSHEFVKANFKNQNSIVVLSGSDLSQSLAAVSAGQVDVGMSDALETQKYARAHSEVTDLFADGPYDLTPIGWTVRHNDFEWLSFLNTAIETLETQGRLALFEAKYEYRWVQPVRLFKPR